MSFRTSLGAAAGAAAGRLGGVGMARRPRAARLCCSRPALSLPSLPGAGRAAPDRLRAKVAVAVLADTSASVPAAGSGDESALADKVERARGRHWMRVIPFARATRAGRCRGAFQGRHGSLRHTAGAAGHATNLEAAIRDGVGVAARRHGAAPAAGLRRQRKPGQRGARHLAGAAARHPHRYRAAGRPSQARAAAGIRRHFRGRCSAASASPSK